MPDNKDRELLLLRIIHLICNKYKNKAILKGGMYFRILNSPRYTQDIDFVFLRSQSRKVLAGEIKSLILKQGDIKIIKIELNSGGVFIDLKSNGIFARIEISIVDKLNTSIETMTTSALADYLKIPPQIISVMSKSESYANKIAASLERETLRDLYDITIFEPLTTFDMKTLKQRLNRLSINRSKPISIGFKEAASRLRERIKKLAQSNLEQELRGIVPEKFLHGGLDIIRSSVLRLCQELEQSNKK